MSSPRSTPPADLTPLRDALIESYRGDARAQHIGKRFLPSRAAMVEILQGFFELIFPGYFGRLELDEASLPGHVADCLARLSTSLEGQIERCLCYRDEVDESDVDVPRCRAHGRGLAARCLAALPELRRKLILDAQAALDGDPAAGSLDEIILSYPGYRAIVVHRIAHELHRLGVPLMPRIMSEWAHTETGADIHPGAEIGERFFIDHATGVVIGETAKIGAGVRLYQGVTLGALSLPRDADGRVKRNPKRHPTVEDDVTVYANATVLGGETVLGRGSVIGGSVFITRSVPAGNKVAVDPPRLKVATRDVPEPQSFPPGEIDFEI